MYAHARVYLYHHLLSGLLLCQGFFNLKAEVPWFHSFLLPYALVVSQVCRNFFFFFFSKKLFLFKDLSFYLKDRVIDKEGKWEGAERRRWREISSTLWFTPQMAAHTGCSWASPKPGARFFHVFHVGAGMQALALSSAVFLGH